MYFKFQYFVCVDIANVLHLRSDDIRYRDGVNGCCMGYGAFIQYLHKKINTPRSTLLKVSAVLGVQER